MKKEHRSGIYLLPNLLTTAGLFAGYYSIVASFKMHFEAAAMAIFIGIITDGLDGRIARITNSQTPFGGQYDSLSDMVSFGVAPSLLLYSWHLHNYGKIGWLIAFLYTAATALRLARFNVQTHTDKTYFQGLACPAAAGLISSYVWIATKYHWHSWPLKDSALVITFILAVLMVSNLRYYSFKEVTFNGKVPSIYILIIIILFVAIAAYPTIVLFSAFSLYALSGFVTTKYILTRAKQLKKDKKP